MVAQPQSPQEIIVRPLRESDLTTAESIMRLAFGTFLGGPSSLCLTTVSEVLIIRDGLTTLEGLGIFRSPSV